MLQYFSIQNSMVSLCLSLFKQQDYLNLFHLIFNGKEKNCLVRLVNCLKQQSNFETLLLLNITHLFSFFSSLPFSFLKFISRLNFHLLNSYLIIMDQRVLQEAPASDIEIHYLMMVIAWLLAGNTGLWTQIFKNYKWPVFIHAASMGALTIVTIASSFIIQDARQSQQQENRPRILQSEGRDIVWSFHRLFGWIIFGSAIAQSVGGVLSLILRRNEAVHPKFVKYINLFHRIVGWIIYAMAFVELVVAAANYQTNILIIVVVISSVSYLSYFVKLFAFNKDMQSSKQIEQLSVESLPLIKVSELKKYNGNYFIFSDRIYDIKEVLKSHPGGYGFINSIRERQVDRYIYGSEPIESYEQEITHSHSSGSLELAEQPIGYLQNNPPYRGMSEINLARVHSLGRLKKYCIYLEVDSQNLIFQGYSSLEQLGKYYALTINEKKTRLYSAVNFLHQSNINLMEKIFNKGFSNVLFQRSHSMDNLESYSEKEGNFIPLLIKKYDSGSFTKQFLVSDFNNNITISKQKGKGLMINELTKGEIVIFAGGTGLNPFCDLIDLLLKQNLVQSSSPFSQDILKENPVIQTSNLTTKFKFTIYVSVSKSDQIHQITATQLNFLACKGQIQFWVRQNNLMHQFYTNYPFAKKFDGRFEAVIQEKSERIEDISQIYMCGPVKMTRCMVNKLNSLSIPPTKYKVL